MTTQRAAVGSRLNLDALASHCRKVRRIEGRFQEKHRHCVSCGARWVGYEEKETDVNISAALIEDAVYDRYDTALLLERPEHWR